MNKTVIIEGKEFSENTIKEALKAHCDWKEKYVFQAGDVVVNRKDKFNGINSLRVIVRYGGKMVSFDFYGNKMSEGQDAFEFYQYEQIGVMSDLMKK